MIRDFHVVMICSGNTCRSPMAEALLRDKLSRIPGKGARISVSSVGLFAFEGEPASALAIETMKARGIDMSGHKARPLTAEIVGGADLILTMTGAHKDAVIRRYPEAQGKVLTLAEFSGVADAGDVQDPVGGSSEDYRRVAGQIEFYLDGVVKRLGERLPDEDSDRE